MYISYWVRPFQLFSILFGLFQNSKTLEGQGREGVKSIPPWGVYPCRHLRGMIIPIFIYNSSSPVHHLLSETAYNSKALAFEIPIFFYLLFLCLLFPLPGYGKEQRNIKKYRSQTLVNMSHYTLYFVTC